MFIGLRQTLSLNLGGHLGVLVCKVGTVVGATDILYILEAPMFCEVFNHYWNSCPLAALMKNAHVSLCIACLPPGQCLPFSLRVFSGSPCQKLPMSSIFHALCWCLNLSSQPFDATKSLIYNFSASIEASSCSIIPETDILECLHMV